MNSDQRALGKGKVGHNNDSPTCRILHNPTSTINRSEFSCWEKNNLPSSIAVNDIDREIKDSDDLENEYDGIQTWKQRARIMLETMMQ